MPYQNPHTIKKCMRCRGTALHPVKKEIGGEKVRCVECGYEFVFSGYYMN